jgi:hypothetical protein
MATTVKLCQLRPGVPVNDAQPINPTEYIVINRKPRSEIAKDALAELDAKIKVAKETGNPEDVYLAKGILRGLDLARLFHGAEGDASKRKLKASIEDLIPSA